jgi:hypothetical protein
MEPQLSILICSLESRAGMLASLLRHLTAQAQAHGSEVEVLVDVDDGTKSIGQKRNDLLERACGNYVAFVDDDDWVPEYYVSEILIALHDNPDVDCLGLHGAVAVDNGQPAPFIHSVQCKSWFQRDGVYYRSPNHLNPVKRSIALDTRFPNIDHGEDHDYSRGLQNRIHHEVMLPRGMYHYAARGATTTAGGGTGGGGGHPPPQLRPAAHIPFPPLAPGQMLPPPAPPFQASPPHQTRPGPFPAPPPVVSGAPIVQGPFPPTTITTSHGAPSTWQVPAPVPNYTPARVRTADGVIQFMAPPPLPLADVPPPGPPRPSATSPPSPAYPLPSPQPCPVNPTGETYPPRMPNKPSQLFVPGPEAAVAAQLSTPNGRFLRSDRRRRGQ